MRLPCCVGVRCLVLGRGGGKFEGGDEAGLLVQATEVADQIYNGVLFLERLIGQGVIKVVEGLFDLVRIVGADVFVIGIVQQLQNGVGIGAEFLHIHSSVLLVVGGEVKAAVGAEFLEFDLGCYQEKAGYLNHSFTLF